MSEGALTPFTPEGVPTDEFAALLDKGKAQGALTPDDLMQVLERVELSSDVINAVKGRVQAEGIALVDEDVADDPLDPEDPEVGQILREVMAEAGAEDEPATNGDAPATNGDGPADDGAKPPAIEQGPGVPLVNLEDEGERRAVTRLAVVESGSSGPSSDYVRMYLKEIGKVS